APCPASAAGARVRRGRVAGAPTCWTTTGSPPAARRAGRGGSSPKGNEGRHVPALVPPARRPTGETAFKAGTPRFQGASFQACPYFFFGAFLGGCFFVAFFTGLAR